MKLATDLGHFVLIITFIQDWDKLGITFNGIERIVLINTSDSHNVYLQHYISKNIFGRFENLDSEEVLLIQNFTENTLDYYYLTHILHQI